MKLIGILTLAAMPTFAQSSVPPRNPKKEVREIRATGCVRKAAQSRCLLLTTLDGSATYSFLVAPKPELGTVVTIQGAPHQGSSICKSGMAIDVSDWEPTGEKCVE